MSRIAAPRRRGSVLIEFALIALVLYLLLAATIEFGRVMYSAQAVQQAADVAARELAKVPLPPTATFEQAMESEQVRRQVYSPDYLVVRMDLVPDGDIGRYFQNAPPVNRMLLPLMIVDNDNPAGALLRYPGNLTACTGTFFPNAATNPDRLTVNVPLITTDGAGNEILRPESEWPAVIEEVRPTGAAEGPFGLTAPDPNPPESRGVVALRINYPYQAAALVSYPPRDPATPFDPTPTNNALTPNPTLDGDGRIGPNAGSSGLGRLEAVGRQVRPFRKVLTAQAFARREMFDSPPTTP